MHTSTVHLSGQSAPYTFSPSVCHLSSTYCDCLMESQLFCCFLLSLSLTQYPPACLPLFFPNLTFTPAVSLFSLSTPVRSCLLPPFLSFNLSLLPLSRQTQSRVFRSWCTTCAPSATPYASPRQSVHTAWSSAL